MNRQVDVKALISHIVRGDGADKCRICMGDTSEGQVYLGDTVMMDGDRPVTLSEILEIITGVEVPVDAVLPGGLCPTCNESALTAAAFRNFCLQSTEQWHTAMKQLSNLHTLDDYEDKSSVYAIINMHNDKMTPDIGFEVAVENQFKEEYLSDESADDNIYVDDEVKIRKPIKIETVGKVYKCPDCEKTFRNPKSLYDHLKYSMENKTACYICAAIMTREDLVKHLKNDHKAVVYTCKKCPVLLQTVKQLHKHLAEAHSPGAHYCGDCGRSFKSSYALHGHTTLHLTKNCPGCDKLFRNRKCYTIHVTECCNLDVSRKDAHRTKSKVMFEVKNVNNDQKLKVGARGSADKECICDYCGKTYAGKKFVCAHIQIVHMKNTHRPCPYCGKSYAAAHMTEHIKRHEKTHHFTCEHCGFSLRTKLGYIQHIRLHTGEKPYKCRYCPATFSASSRRSEHVRNTHKTDQIVLKHCCDLCPAKFRLPYRLKQHIDSVHKDKDDKEAAKEFECPECHIKFSSYRSLLYHRRKHQSFSFSAQKKENTPQLSIDTKKVNVQNLEIYNN